LPNMHPITVTKEVIMEARIKTGTKIKVW